MPAVFESCLNNNSDLTFSETTLKLSKDKSYPSQEPHAKPLCLKTQLCNRDINPVISSFTARNRQ